MQKGISAREMPFESQPLSLRIYTKPKTLINSMPIKDNPVSRKSPQQSAFGQKEKPELNRKPKLLPKSP
jgi:hypothetical protein